MPGIPFVTSLGKNVDASIENIQRAHSWSKHMIIENETSSSSGNSE